ncbi:MAG: exodeoxyribonuclease VII large subunit [Cyanobacteriota bacterium]|nr:exodeoxyribonuclease VII large subunit [Cyanobacteriota bacterium]
MNPTSLQLPRYSVAALNAAIASLLERGFAPRFLLEATVSRPQLKKGHLWLTLVDEEASISAVVWASQLPRLSFQPQDGDGVVVVGKLNFWASRASLCVQVLDVRPSLSSVLRRFEQVREALAAEGLFRPERKRALPHAPGRVALLTSVPSSALADMLRTARERWPATGIVLVPIPVQGAIEAQICEALHRVAAGVGELGIEAIVIARGGGSREDLAVFDSEVLARCIAALPVPVVCGIGHEDDTTIADLVADHRAATPTAAIVALLPDRQLVHPALQQLALHLRQTLGLRLHGERQQLERLQERLLQLHPREQLQRRRVDLKQARRLLQALSPQHLLGRGFSLVRRLDGSLVRSVADLQEGLALTIDLANGQAITQLGPTVRRQSDDDRPGDRSDSKKDFVRRTV